MAINFISSKDSEETCDAHTKGDILKIMIKAIKQMNLLEDFLIRV